MTSRYMSGRGLRTAVRAASALIAISLVAACGLPAASPAEGGASPSPAPTGQSTLTAGSTSTPEASPSSLVRRTAVFGVPTSMVVPPTWTELGPENPSYYFTGRSRQIVDEPLVGIDLALVSNTYVDPCHRSTGRLDPPLGPTVDDLVAYMFDLAPLNATRAGTLVVDGYEGQVVDEAFIPTAECPAELLMWDGGNGNVFVTERKRYIVLDVGGQRVVVIIVAYEPEWDNVLPEAMGVVQTIDFNAP